MSAEAAWDGRGGQGKVNIRSANTLNSRKKDWLPFDHNNK